jgi:transcriptional regulator with XRE-family HTH domain
MKAILCGGKMTADAGHQIGIRIRNFREKAGMSLAELSRKSGISRGYLYQIERGESSPTQDKLLDIAEALGVLVSELIGEIEGYADLPNVPESLRQFAEEKNIPYGDVMMLSRIKYRGQQPKTKDEWKLLYNVIKGIIDEE